MIHSRNHMSKQTPVLERDSLVWWDFSTSRFDIGFGVTFHPLEGGVLPVTADNTLSRYCVDLATDTTGADSLNDGKILEPTEAVADSELIVHLEALCNGHAGAFGLSYRNVKERLIAKFGQAAFEKNKAAVSSIMESMMRQRHPQRAGCNASMMVVRETRRVKAHRTLQRGVARAPCQGHFELHWDNTYSKMRKKTLTYRISSGPPASLFRWLGPHVSRIDRQLVHKLIRSHAKERSASLTPPKLLIETRHRLRAKTESLNSESNLSVSTPIPIPDSTRRQTQTQEEEEEQVSFSMTVCEHLFGGGGAGYPLGYDGPMVDGAIPSYYKDWVPSRPTAPYDTDCDLDEAEL